jgi:hypothetical protein
VSSADLRTTFAGGYDYGSQMARMTVGTLHLMVSHTFATR